MRGQEWLVIVQHVDNEMAQLVKNNIIFKFCFYQFSLFCEQFFSSISFLFFTDIQFRQRSNLSRGWQGKLVSVPSMLALEVKKIIKTYPINEWRVLSKTNVQRQVPLKKSC